MLEVVEGPNSTHDDKEQHAERKETVGKLVELPIAQERRRRNGGRANKTGARAGEDGKEGPVS